MNRTTYRAGLSILQFFSKISSLFGNEKMVLFFVLFRSVLPLLFCVFYFFLKFRQFPNFFTIRIYIFFKFCEFSLLCIESIDKSLYFNFLY